MSHNLHQPHFILDGIRDPATVEQLQELESAIYTDATAVKDAVDALATYDETDGQQYDEAINLAISKEVGLEFDEVTEETIVRSATMKLLREKRKDNQQNENRSQELAAEVRRVRLAMFIDQVMEYKIAEILAGDMLPVQERADISETAAKNITA